MAWWAGCSRCGRVAGAEGRERKGATCAPWDEKAVACRDSDLPPLYELTVRHFSSAQVPSSRSSLVQFGAI